MSEYIILIGSFVVALLKSKTPKIYKNKNLNNANFGGFSLNEYQVFLHLISKLGKVDELGKYQQPEELERVHILSAKEFSLIFNVDLSNCYYILKKSVKKLMKTSVILEKPDLFQTWEINVCSRAEYNHKEGCITIKFTDDIMPYLAQVKQRFVLYNLKEVANFGSLYTTRLYELVQEYKDTGYLIKSIEQLRTIFAVGTKYQDYFDFKKRTFTHAIDEINSQYEINLNFEEIKEGKRVVAIKFSFKQTFIVRGVDRTGKEKNIYLKPKRKQQIK